MNFFTINSDFDHSGRKGHGAKVPGSEMARERKGQGVSWPGSESARVLLADSLRGVNWPGSEKARYLKLYKRSKPVMCTDLCYVVCPYIKFNILIIPHIPDVNEQSKSICRVL